MKLSDNAIKVLESRYLQKDADGNILESPDELFRRVAEHIAKAELHFGGEADRHEWAGRFKSLMSELKFLPNSPTLMNAGLPLNQLSACFVLPVEDKMESIFDTLKHTALIQQSGGGTGFNFSRLRPKGAYIASTSGESSGPVAFMNVYDCATQHIKQGGKRRGANMGILNIEHPDIEEFISFKRDETRLCNFNISVGMTDDFMRAMMRDDEWQLRDPSNGKAVKVVPARALWNKIVENAWHTGDPGMIFLDTINAANPTPALGRMDCTNPCGEIPLLPYEACNLGSVNLTKFVKNGVIDWNELADTIAIAVRFLDNVIEMNNYVIPEIEQVVKGNRKIGLGVMGWAEMLIMLEIPYASEEALQLAEELMSFVNDKSRDASAQLAEKRRSFLNWEKSIYYPHLQVRNATRTCVAPTGTISIIAGTSSSIEPLIALAYKRENVLNNERLEDVSEIFLEYVKKHNYYSEELLRLVRSTGSIQQSSLPEKEKELFKTSLEIAPHWHIKHQVAFQRYTDNAVSKTINLPKKASLTDVEDAYRMAWELKAKGVTVFRWGSKEKQVLSTGLDNQGTCQVCAV